MAAEKDRKGMNLGEALAHTINEAENPVEAAVQIEAIALSAMNAVMELAKQPPAPALFYLGTDGRLTRLDVENTLTGRERVLARALAHTFNEKAKADMVAEDTTWLKDRTGGTSVDCSSWPARRPPLRYRDPEMWADTIGDLNLQSIVNRGGHWVTAELEKMPQIPVRGVVLDKLGNFYWDDTYNNEMVATKQFRVVKSD